MKLETLFMRLKNIAIALAMLFSSVASAQLRSMGPVPTDLKMTMDELYKMGLTRAEKYSDGGIHNHGQLVEASYHLSKMMASGRILYGDPVTHMVERIADTLLRDYPELRSELRFYTINSPEVNAFATSQGMVFVNLGLVAQAENEAQLAFILSHEIVHYVRAHAVENLKSDKKRKKPGQTAEYDSDAAEMDNFLRMHNRSRAMESEADSLGIVMFYSRSPYSQHISEGVFDVLQYGPLPFDDVPFDTTFFNTPYYQLTGCWLKEVTGITSRDNYDDSRSTHPNILTRRRRCASLLPRGGGVPFVTISQADFEALRQEARQECVRQEIIHGQFARAFYNAWLLKHERYMVYSLYEYAMNRTHGSSVVHTDFTVVQGESQQVYYALQAMSIEQLLLAALHVTWQAHMAHPTDAEYARMSDHLMEQLRFAAKRSKEDYLSEIPGPSEVQDSLDGESLSKYDRIRQKRKTQTENTPASYALTDLMMSDSTLAARLASFLDGVADTTHIADTVGKDGVMVFNPVSVVYNSLSDEMKVAKSASVERRLTRRVAGTAARLGMHSVDFSDEGLRAMTCDTQYNDFMTLCEWMNEFWLNKGSFRVELMMQPQMDELSARHDARSVNLTALLNEENRSSDVHLVTALFLPTLPLTMVGMFTGIEKTALATLLVDTREGKVMSRHSYSYNVADHNDLLDAMLYDSYRRAMRPSVNLPKGFLGRRMVVSGGFSMGLSGARPIQKGHIVAFTPWASIEYAVSRNYSLVLSARYHKAYDDVVSADYKGILFGLGEDDYDNASSDAVPVSRSMWFFNFDFRRYMRSDFAPLGFYFSMGLHGVHMSELYGDGGENTLGLHAGVGRSYALFDRLMFGYEISYAYTYGFHKVVGFARDSRPYGHYADAIFSNILTIRLGIGFLPF